MTLEEQIYLNKKVCIIGCGSSVDSKKINFSEYEIIVGINRIYQTKYFNYINILYDSAHYIFDPVNTTKVKILNESKLNYYFLIPGIKSLYRIKIQMAIFEKIKIKKHIYKERHDIKVDGKKLLSGLFTLNTILKGKPLSIDIYGFDFYENNYIQNLEYKHDIKIINEMHNLEKEKKYLETIIEKNKIVNWMK